MFFIQLAVLLIFMFIGVRMSGIGLGVMGMIGLLILLFIFRLEPSDPPLEVMLIILSVITAAAALQTAEPKATYYIALFAGTAHISYSKLPIVTEGYTNNKGFIISTILTKRSLEEIQTLFIQY